MGDDMTDRYDYRDLTRFASQLLQATGMADAMADTVAEVLVAGDLLGKSTHGLALLPLYLAEIDQGKMAVDGGPVLINDVGACLTWDGRKLPGPWLVRRAVDEAIARAARFGMGAVAIQRSHHAACLGAYLEQATERGLMVMITLTDPSHTSVAPFGGTRPVLTSNPIAFGAPTEGEPILIDTSTSMATNSMVARHKREGRLFDHPWLMDNEGRPSRDPAVLGSNPPGTILPIGGLDAGQKGYGLGLMVELLTGCLTGRGRADAADGWSAAQALGEPNIYPEYGDFPTSWATLNAEDPNEYLELGFDQPAPISSVSIYETYAPGAVAKVSVRNPNNNQWVEVWSGPAAPAPAVARIFTVTFPQTIFPVSAVRIDLDSPAVPDWNVIDAVSISW